MIINCNDFDISIEGNIAAVSHDGILLAVIDHNREGGHIPAGKETTIRLTLKIMTECARNHIGEMIELGADLTKSLIIRRHFVAKGIKAHFMKKSH